MSAARGGGKPPKKPFSGVGHGGGKRGAGGPPRKGSPPWQRDDGPQGRHEGRSGGDEGERPPQKGPPPRQQDYRPPGRGRPPWQREDEGQRGRWEERPAGGEGKRAPRREPPPWQQAERPRGSREEEGGGEWRARQPGPRGGVAGPPMVAPPSYRPEDLAKAGEKVSAACLEVQRQLGPALEPMTYHRALALEMQARGIPFEREARVPISYKDRQIDTRRVDFVVEGCLVEIKSQSALPAEEITRTTNYLKASGYKYALLVNFGPPKVEIRTLSLQEGR